MSFACTMSSCRTARQEGAEKHERMHAVLLSSPVQGCLLLSSNTAIRHKVNTYSMHLMPSPNTALSSFQNKCLDDSSHREQAIPTLYCLPLPRMRVQVKLYALLQDPPYPFVTRNMVVANG
eukprot:scaffold131270_cov27-Tisochrysis_lutea.AAC.1